MKDNLTEIVFILDRSGSMSGLESDTIGGFNSFVEKQKLEPGDALLTTVLFDDKYEVLYSGVKLPHVKPLTENEYFVRGNTALLDAIGLTITTVGTRLYLTDEKERASKVLFVITTDGLENSSHEFTYPMIKEMIERQTDVYKWQFLFLGANIDAVSVGRGIGIHMSTQYSGNQVGTQSLYNTVSNTTAKYRSQGTVDKDWDKDIE